MPNNRVLVGLPERLRKRDEAVRELEGKIEAIKTIYSQRLTLTDSTVVDHIGEILNLPRIEGDSIAPEDRPPSERREEAARNQDRALGETLRANYPEQFGDK